MTGAGFADWLAGFRGRALAHGIRAAHLDSALAPVRPLPQVLEKDRAQTEFTLTVRDYLARVITPARIAAGLVALETHRGLFDRIEARFPVPRTILAAIWGVETSYGANRGGVALIAALATLAHDGRRAAFFEAELLAALDLAARCGLAPSALHGSWAGASGHMQFMPSSALAHGVDFDGDGRVDLLSDDPADALASAAAYLRHFGWQPGQAAIAVARLSPGFDVALAGRDRSMEAAGWQARGAVPDRGPPSGELSLILPAGAAGPALFWGANATVLARYNGSESYVVAVALLADRLSGAPDPDLAWPEGDRALSLAEKRELQIGLAALGHDPGAADGRIGPNTIRALKGWQMATGLAPDGYASAAMLDHLRRALAG